MVDSDLMMDSDLTVDVNSLVDVNLIVGANLGILKVFPWLAAVIVHQNGAVNQGIPRFPCPKMNEFVFLENAFL